jgi:hypothetical protein
LTLTDYLSACTHGCTERSGAKLGNGAQPKRI